MRLDQIIRCYQIIDALQRPGGVSAKQLSSILECSLKTAYRYIDAASCVLRVVDDGNWPRRFKLKPPIAIFDKRSDFQKTKTHNLRIGAAVRQGIRL